MELLNTAIGVSHDLIVLSNFYPRINKIAKDCAVGAVLICNGCASVATFFAPPLTHTDSVRSKLLKRSGVKKWKYADYSHR